MNDQDSIFVWIGLRTLPRMNRHARAVSGRQQQANSSHRIVRRNVLVVDLGPFGFESAIVQGEADVGRDRDALQFGKFELLNAKVRMGRSPDWPYIKYRERSSSSVAN